MRPSIGFTAIALSLTATVLSAQAPAAPAKPQSAPAAAAAQSTATTPPASAPELYSYSPEGRRDPFVSLLGAGSTEPSRMGASRKTDGPAGMLFNEISVRGVLQSRGALIAMVEGPDKKTYIVHAGDKLADGTIRSITPQGLVVIQEVNDPLSLVKQREVRKLLRSLEDAKE